MSQYDHHEIKIIGDSFMVIFRTALDAFDFALALHEDTGHERVKVRAGIHVGAPHIFEDDLLGLMVNYTKRVESTDNNHGIRLSDVAKIQIADEGAQRHSLLTFHPLELRFKGFAEHQKIWAVGQRPFLELKRRALTERLIQS